MVNFVLWKVMCYIPDPNCLLERCYQKNLCQIDIESPTSVHQAKMVALRDIAEEAGLTRDQARPDSVLMTKESTVPVPALRVQSNMKNLPRLSREGNEQLRKALGPGSKPEWVWLNNFRERQANFEKRLELKRQTEGNVVQNSKPGGNKKKSKKNKTKSIRSIDTSPLPF